MRHPHLLSEELFSEGHTQKYHICVPSGHWQYFVRTSIDNKNELKKRSDTTYITPNVVTKETRSKTCDFFTVLSFPQQWHLVKVSWLNCRQRTQKNYYRYVQRPNQLNEIRKAMNDIKA